MKTKKLEKMNGAELANYWRVSAMTISRWLQRGVPVHDPVAMTKWARSERRLAPDFEVRLSELYTQGVARDWAQERIDAAADAARRKVQAREDARIAKLPKPPEPPTEQERRSAWRSAKAEMLAVDAKYKQGLVTAGEMDAADQRACAALCQIRGPQVA